MGCLDVLNIETWKMKLTAGSNFELRCSAATEDDMGKRRISAATIHALLKNLAKEYPWIFSEDLDERTYDALSDMHMASGFSTRQLARPNDDRVSTDLRRIQSDVASGKLDRGDVRRYIDELTANSVDRISRDFPISGIALVAAELWKQVEPGCPAGGSLLYFDSPGTPLPLEFTHSPHLAYTADAGTVAAVFGDTRSAIAAAKQIRDVVEHPRWVCGITRTRRAVRTWRHFEQWLQSAAFLAHESNDDAISISGVKDTDVSDVRLTFKGTKDLGHLGSQNIYEIT
jgi:hypothetical protein